MIIDKSIIFDAAYQKTGPKAKAEYGVLLLLLSCPKDGSFALPSKYVEEHLGIAKNTFYKALNKLEESGLIEWDRSERIVVNMEELLRGINF